MYKWNSDKIIAFIQTLDCIEDVLNDGPGGDVDTDNLCAKVRGTGEYIYVCGFNVDNDIPDPYECDVEMVEITDQSGDGLQSNDFTIAQAYIAIRQYFVGQDVPVVNRLKDYF